MRGLRRIPIGHRQIFLCEAEERGRSRATLNDDNEAQENLDKLDVQVILRKFPYPWERKLYRKQKMTARRMPGGFCVITVSITRRL